jgi:hypothetical protein
VEAVIATPPKITYSPWVTPRSLDDWLASGDSLPGFPRLRAAVDDYIEVACRPLASLPLSERAVVGDHVVRHAIAGTDARWRVVLALDEFTSGDPKWLVRLGERLHEGLPRLRASAGRVFARDYVGCLEMALRVHWRTLRQLIAALPGRMTC